MSALTSSIRPKNGTSYDGTVARNSEASRMARKLRVAYPGAIYHVMIRGDRREAIVRDDADRKRFVATLAESLSE